MTSNYMVIGYERLAAKALVVDSFYISARKFYYVRNFSIINAVLENVSNSTSSLSVM